MPVGWLPRQAILRWYLKRLSPSLVHGFRTLTGYGFLASRSGYPSLMTVEELISDCYKTQGATIPLRIGRSFEARWLRCATDVIAVSRDLSEKLAVRCDGRIHIVPNIVAGIFFRVGRLAPTCDLMTVGRVCPEKGVLDLITAAAMVGARSKRLTLRVVGGVTGPDGESYLAACMETATRLQKYVAVEFLGWRRPEEIADLYRTTSAAVFPSTAPYETFCISVAEALAAGVPSIVYDHGPLPEHIIEGRNGHVVPAGNIQQLSDCIGLLLAEPSRLSRMGDCARLAADRYRASAVLEATLQIYHRLSRRNSSMVTRGCREADMVGGS